MSILNQVRGELNESRKKALKSRLKEKITEYEKAEAIRQGILSDMASIIKEAGEDPNDLNQLLSD